MRRRARVRRRRDTGVPPDVGAVRSFTQCRRYVGSAAPKEKSAMRNLCLLRMMVALLSALIMTGAAAQQPARLEVIVFAGGFNWPIWVAQEKAFFRENGVDVNVSPTPGSVYQLVNLIDG